MVRAATCRNCPSRERPHGTDHTSPQLAKRVPSGRRTVPQCGHLPGLACRTLGCIGQYRALCAGSQLSLPEVPRHDAKLQPLFELQQWHCRWPIGDPSSESFGFCGSRPIEGLPYCATHARLAYRPSSRTPTIYYASAALVQVKAQKRPDWFSREPPGRSTVQCACVPLFPRL